MTAIELYKSQNDEEQYTPLSQSSVSAGFPSPADNFSDLSIDLNKEFVKNKNSTFFAKVSGDSMINAGLDDGDLLIIDKSLEARDNKIAVCFIDGDFTVKRIRIKDDAIYLVAENDNYSTIKVSKDNDFIIWGIVTTIIKNV